MTIVLLQNLVLDSKYFIKYDFKFLSTYFRVMFPDDHVVFVLHVCIQIFIFDYEPNFPWDFFSVHMTED